MFEGLFIVLENIVLTIVHIFTKSGWSHSVWDMEWTGVKFALYAAPVIFAFCWGKGIYEWVQGKKNQGDDKDVEEQQGENDEVV